MIATGLLKWSGGRSSAIAWYLIGLAMVGLAAVYFSAETFRADLSEARSAEEKKPATEPEWKSG